jgi:hypothetical protein
MQTEVSGNVTGLDNEGADRSKMKSCTLKTNKILLSAITLLLCSMLNFGLWQYVQLKIKLFGIFQKHKNLLQR